jgi:hypothetical protein
LEKKTASPAPLCRGGRGAHRADGGTADGHLPSRRCSVCRWWLAVPTVRVSTPAGAVPTVRCRRSPCRRCGAIGPPRLSRSVGEENPLRLSFFFRWVEVGRCGRHWATFFYRMCFTPVTMLKVGQDVSHGITCSWVSVICFYVPRLTILIVHSHDPTVENACAGVSSEGWVFNRIICCN